MLVLPLHYRCYSFQKCCIWSG